MTGGRAPFQVLVQPFRQATLEETGLSGEFVALDARATIPVVAVTGEFTWGPDVLVVRKCRGRS